MHRAFFILLAVSSIAWCENSLTRQEKKDGFELLFDGKSIGRWHSIRRQPDKGAWHAQKGVLVPESGESWLATNDTYYDFVLRLEYKTGPGSDSGIFLRSDPKGRPDLTGMELQILGDAGKPVTNRITGSVWDIVPPAKNAAKPEGEWNQVEVSLIKRQLIAIWNGEKILDVNLDDRAYPALAERRPYGHVGLQAHTNGTPVEFRNIRIKVIKIGPLFIPEQ